MGITDGERVRLADALFTQVQQRVLGILFGRPDRSFLSSEVIELANSGTGAAHRELKRLAASGLVTVRTVGRQKHYQANRDAPVFEELHALIVKTVGLTEPIREALAPLAGRIQFAFVYGSHAKGTATATSDVDLMIVSDDLSYAETHTALEAAEAALARRINPTILPRADWRKRREADSHFVKTVTSQPKVFVLGEVSSMAIEDIEVVDAVPENAAEGETMSSFFDVGPDLASLALEQGVEPIGDVGRLVADFWPADESADEFLAAVDGWRSEDHAA